MTTPGLPFERSYWADPGKLMAGYYPGDADEATAQAKLESLLECGVRHVVNLMHETQHPADKSDVVPYRDQLMSIAKEAGINVSYVVQPIVDQDIPSREMMKGILDDSRPSHWRGTSRVRALHGRNRPDRHGGRVLHVAARHGRGRQGHRSHQRVAGQGPLPACPVPNTEAQRGMVRSWKEGE